VAARTSLANRSVSDPDGVGETSEEREPRETLCPRPVPTAGAKPSPDSSSLSTIHSEEGTPRTRLGLLPSSRGRRLTVCRSEK
jgi:hypothetical protein